MNISTKQRGWVLGAALLLTVAATAAVNSQDDGGEVGSKHKEPVTDKEPFQSAPVSKSTSPQSAGLASALDMPGGLLVDKLKRPALPVTAKDMFPVQSWYVPPPPPKVVAAPPPVPVAPPFTYQYIGKMIEDENSHSAVFLENRSRIFIVRTGDKIEGKYRVDEIEPPLMTVTYLPLNIKQTVQIGEAN